MTTSPAPESNVRLCLRPSVNFAPLDDGVLFKDWERSFTITGNRALYPLFERLLPHLERGFTRSALLAAVPPAVRSVVSLLLDRLDEYGMCFRTDGAVPSEAEAEAFAQTLSYLKARAPAPLTAFAHVRGARVAILGAGQAMLAAVRALVSFGVGHIVCQAGAEDLGAIEELLGAQPLIMGQVDQLVAVTDEFDSSEVDLVIHLQDGADRVWLGAVARAVTKPLLQGVLDAECGLAGPLQAGGGPGLGDTIARLRRRFGDRSARVPPVLATLLGNAVGFEALHYLAKLPAKTADGRAVMVTREPLAIDHHVIIAGAEERRPDGSLSGRRTGINANDLHAALGTMRVQRISPEPQDLVDRLRELADEDFGPLSMPHPQELPQVPMFTCRANARLAGNSDDLGEVFGFADTPSEAYLVAGVAALRQMAMAGVSDELTVIAADAVANTADDTADSSDGQRFARALSAQKLVFVVANDYDGWLEAGICEYFLAGFAASSSTEVAIRLRSLVHRHLDANAGLRWKTLTLRFGQEITALHGVIPALPGLHIVAVCTEDACLGLAAGLHPAVTMNRALGEALARVELAEFGIELPSRSQAIAARASEFGDDDAPRELPWSVEGSLTGIIAALQTAGQGVFVHPWTALPGLHERGFLAGWVGVDVR